VQVKRKPCFGRIERLPRKHPFEAPKERIEVEELGIAFFSQKERIKKEDADTLIMKNIYRISNIAFLKHCIYGLADRA